MRLRHHELNEELEFACDLVCRASKIILKYYSRDPKQMGVKWKGKNDPVTDADEASTRFFLEEIGRRFPQDAILIEERKDDSRRRENRRTWVVDPLDGTTEFIAQNGEFTVMAGLLQEGKPTLGAIAVPVERVVYAGIWEEEGGGFAFMQREGEEKVPLTAPPPPPLEEAGMAVSRSHRHPALDAIRERLGIHRELVSGSVGLKVARVISGQANLYVHVGRGIKLWDTCAAEAIAVAAGLEFTDIYGKKIDYTLEDVRLPFGLIVAQKALHAKVVAEVALLSNLDEAKFRE